MLTGIHKSQNDTAFYFCVNVAMGIILVCVCCPLIYVFSSSISSGEAVLAGRVILWPVGFSLDGYKTVFQYQTVLTGYRNSIIYTVIGTLVNVSMTLICAYPLARKTLPMRNMFMFLFTFTMYFSGGLIPNYILVKNLHLINKMWALILPGAISVYNMIIARTFFQNSIPEEMIEATQIDGCNDIRFFFVMLLPLSKAIIAVLTLYYAVAHWNLWFSAFIYLSDRSRYPLQLVLREILIVNQLDPANIDDPELAERLMNTAQLLKYSLIVIASVPMLIIYPFVQKYFIKGIMIGSLKG